MSKFDFPFPNLSFLFKLIDNNIDWLIISAKFLRKIGLGFLTRFVAIQLIGLLAVATFYIHLKNGFLWVKGGYEYPLFWLVIMIAIFFKGGDRVSIDNSLPKEF